MQRRIITRLAVLLPAALAAVLLTPGTAHAYQVTVQVVGAGTIVEDTDARELPTCSNSYGTQTLNCVAGTTSGDYGWGWVVTYTASPRAGYEFSHWESPSTTAVICDQAKGARTYSGETCTFQTFDNLSVKAVFVDTTKPDPPTFRSTPSSPTNLNAAFFEAAPTTDLTVSERKWRLDGGSWSTGYSANVRNLSDGTHTFEMKAVDYAGNESLPRTYNWTVDTVAPAVTMLTPADGAATKDADLTISGTTSGGATQVFVEDNNAQIGTAIPLASGAWGYKHVNPQPGTHTYRVRARDAAGNFSEPATATVVVDRLPPHLSVLSPADGTYDADGTVLMNGSAEPGSTVRVAETGTEPATVVTGENGLWSLSLEGLEQGAHTFDVTASDLAGNTSPAERRTVTVDTIVPIATALSPANGAVRVSRRANVTAAFSEQVDSTTIKASTVYLVRKGTTKKIPAKVVYDAAGTRVTIDPRDRLRKKTVYVATVTRGVRDLAGHKLLTKLRWSFKTAG